MNSEDFPDRVRAFLRQASSLPPLEEPAKQAIASVDAHEPAVALATLAWMIVGNNLIVPEWLVQRHASLTRELAGLAPVTTRFPFSLPAHIEGSESARNLKDPGGRGGQLIAMDTDERIPISSWLHYWGFKSWFWYQVDDSLELLIDEYEGVLIPPPLVQPLAGELTRTKARGDFPPGLTDEVDRLVAFLQSAADRGAAIEVDL